MPQGMGCSWVFEGQTRICDDWDQMSMLPHNSCTYCSTTFQGASYTRIQEIKHCDAGSTTRTRTLYDDSGVKAQSADVVLLPSEVKSEKDTKHPVDNFMIANLNQTNILRVCITSGKLCTRSPDSDEKE